MTLERCVASCLVDCRRQRTGCYLQLYEVFYTCSTVLPSTVISHRCRPISTGRLPSAAAERKSSLSKNGALLRHLSSMLQVSRCLCFQCDECVLFVTEPIRAVCARVIQQTNSVNDDDDDDDDIKQESPANAKGTRDSSVCMKAHCEQT